MVVDVNKDLDDDKSSGDEFEDDKVNQILGLNNKESLKALFKNTPEFKQFNIFNKIYTKHKENLYFFKIVNDYDIKVSHVKLVRFNLFTLKESDVLTFKIESEDTEIHTIHDEDKLEVKKTFGIS
jgi:hypothetical protein